MADGVDAIAPDAIAALARHSLRTRFEELPAAVVTATKREIADTLAVAVAGRSADGASQLWELAVEFGGRPEARLWGSGVKVPAHDAARVNATMAHALEFDDTYEPAVLHAGVITVPAALTVAELCADSRPVTGRELIACVAAAADVACRMARAGRPGIPAFETGWHNTSLYGYFAATLVAGRLLRLNEQQLVSALGIAYHQCAGNAQAHLEGALTKRIGAGFSAHAGIFAARLAQRGVNGVAEVLEGQRGLYRQYFAGSYSRDLLLTGLGTEFAGAEVSFKPWPSCRGSHTAIDAALTLRSEAQLEVAQIQRVIVCNGPGEHAMLAAPVDRKRQPATVVEAQFSIPWVVASALQDGTVGLAHLRLDALQNKDILQLAAKIETVQDDSLARPGGGPGGARVEVLLRNGQTQSRRSDTPPGGPDRPIGDDQLRAKVLDCLAVGGIGRERADRLTDDLDTIENLSDVTVLLDHIS